MGIKSTTELTRQECLDRINDVEAKLQKYKYANLSNKKLEVLLERLEEEASEDGYTFDNYIVTGE